MALDKCARCAKLFDRVDSPVCTACAPEEEADRSRVRDVLDGSQDLDAEQVAEAAKVDVTVVLRMINNGLISSLATEARPPCGRCGAPAISLAKKLCRACLEELDIAVARAASRIKAGPKKGTDASPMLKARKILEEKRR